jgi:hypothetical protein
MDLSFHASTGNWWFGTCCITWLYDSAGMRKKKLELDLFCGCGSAKNGLWGCVDLKFSNSFFKWHKNESAVMEIESWSSVCNLPLYCFSYHDCLLCIHNLHKIPAGPIVRHMRGNLSVRSIVKWREGDIACHISSLLCY